MDTTIETLYIFLSEDERFVENDVSSLISKGIIDNEEITSGSSLLVCISRDYLDQPNPTSAIMIRDQVSNVFCPPWRINSVRYETMLPVMNMEGTDLPEIRIITSNREKYDNLDYWLHLSNFEKRFRMYLPDYQDGFVPIESEIRRSDVKALGEMTLKILKLAKYDQDINGPVPGWVFQMGNFWMTRLLALYEIKPLIRIPWIPRMDLHLTRAEFTESLNNPVIIDGPKIGEDLYSCVVDSFEVRKTLMEYTQKLLDFIA